jgi:hypothetical protein
MCSSIEEAGRNLSYLRQILVEEVEKQLVRLLVVGLDGAVLEVSARGHEAVDLVGPPFDDVLDLDLLLPLFDVLKEGS